MSYKHKNIKPVRPVQRSMPTFLRIVEDIKHRVRNGEFKPGDAIPGQAALMDEYGVSLITMRKALNLLYAEKVLYPRAGKGIFVAESNVGAGLHSKGRVGLAFIGNQFYRGMIKQESMIAMQRILGERGLDLVICSDPLAELRNAAGSFYGLVLVGEIERDISDRLRRENVTALVTGEMLDAYCPDTVAQVGGDLDGCVDMAVGYLKEHGHRAFCLALRRGARAWQKSRDYLEQAVARHKIGVAPSVIPIENDSDQNQIVASLKQLKIRPTALLTTGGQMGGHVARLLRDGGVSVPQDISLLAINTVPDELLPLPEISRVGVDQTVVWEEAGRVVIRMIETGQTIFKALPPRLTLGVTCGAAPA